MCAQVIKFESIIIAAMLLAGVIAPLSGCALKKDLVITQSNLNKKISAQAKDTKKIKADLKAHIKEWNKQKKGLYATQAELRSLLAELRQEAGNLHGELEKSTHSSETSAQKSSEQLEKLDKMAQTIMKRILRIEAYLGLEPTEKEIPLGKKADASEKKQPVKKLTGEELYTAAKKLFDDGDYDTAREQFQAFLKENPKSKRADNAQFWIGETYYHEKWYEKAIVEYQKVIEKYPNGNKVAGALLKQGLAFYEIGDKGNAKLILKELIRKFPKSKEAQLAEKKLTRIK